MTTTAWAHLPNAEHIDRILADLRLRPQAWEDAYAALDEARVAARDAALDTAWYATRDAARAAARVAAWDDARDATWDVARVAAWDDARDAAQDAARYAAWDALLAFIAWDDCAYILDLHPHVVRLMAASGNQPAILLESAVIAMHGGYDG